MGVRQGWQKLIGKAPASSGSAIGGYGYQTAPKRGTKEILDIYSKNPQIRAPVQRIAEDITSVPWKAYKRPKNLEPVRMALRSAKPWERARVIRGLQDREDLTEDPNHEALGVLDAGNPLLTGRQVRVLCRIYLELAGEAFLLVEKDRKGRAAQLWPIPPHEVIDFPMPGKSDVFKLNSGWWGTKSIPAEEIVWLKYADPKNPYGRGSGMGLALAQEIDIGEYSAAMIISRVFNMAMPDAIVVAKGLSEADGKKLKEQWLQDHRGPFKRGAPLFSDAEDLKVHVFDNKVDDRAIMEVYQATRGEIRKAEGVPPEVMGESENSNKASIFGAKDMYTSFGLVPRLDFDEDQFNERILPALGYRDVILLYESPVPEDDEFILSVMQAMPAAFRVDEIRRLAKQEELGEGNGGDLHAVPFTLYLRRLDEEPAEPPGGNDTTSPPPEDPEDEDPPDDTEDDLDDEEKAFLAIHKRNETAVDQIAAAATRETLLESTEQAFRRGVADWVEFAAAETGIDFSADRIEALTRQHMAGFGSVRIPGINATTQKKIRKALVRGLREGKGPDELAGEIKRVFGYMADSRALMIAQTEVTRSSAWASNKVMEVAGVTHREWAATRINTRDTHLAMDGQVQPAGNRFYSPSGVTARYPGDFGVAAEDINCFVGETVVAAPSGAEGVYRSRYTGELVEVRTASGKSLTGTPNHPVLTQRGWVALGSLNPADYLLCSVERVSGHALGADVEHGPTVLEEVFQLASVSRPAVRLQATAGKDLHGDLTGEGKIDVVPIDGLLRERLAPERFKQLSDTSFSLSGFGLRDLVSGRESASLFGGSPPAPNSIVGGGDESRALLGTRLVHSKLLGGCTTSGVDSSLDKAKSDDVAGDTELLGKRLLAEAVGVERSDLVDVEPDSLARGLNPIPNQNGFGLPESDTEFPGDSHDAMAGSEEFDGSVVNGLQFERVVGMTFFDSCTHVYNLQTTAGWYMANGIVAHNCRCVVLPSNGIKSRSGETLGALWKMHDRRRERWIEMSEEAFARAFQRQEKAVLASLRLLKVEVVA